MTIAALSDAQAVATLALVLERQGRTVDPFAQAEEEAHLKEALAQPEIADHVRPDPNATRGALARTALTHLADGNEAARHLIDRTLADPPTAGPDLALVGIGALILLAFRADLDLVHQPGKGWRFRFHTGRRSDPTIATLLSQLRGNLGER